MSETLTPSAAPSSSARVTDPCPAVTSIVESRGIAVESSPLTQESVPAKTVTFHPDAIPAHIRPKNKGGAIGKRRRRKAGPKDSKIYKVVRMVIAMRAQGIAAREIAEDLGYSTETIRNYVHRAYQRGWINISAFNDIDDKLEFAMKNKVVSNLMGLLNEGDKDVTIEAAKGLGLFKTHQVAKVESQQNVGVALKVQVEMPPAIHVRNTPQLRPGTIGGAPGLDIPVEAELVTSEE